MGWEIQDETVPECQECRDTGYVIHEHSDPQKGEYAEFCDCPAGEAKKAEYEDWKADPS